MTAGGDNPTMGWPIRFEGTAFAAVATGSRAAIEESVARIIAVEQGTLDDLPGLGLPAFEQFADGRAPEPAEIAALIRSQEPLADQLTVVRMPQQDQGWDALSVAVNVPGDR